MNIVKFLENKYQNELKLIDYYEKAEKAYDCIYYEMPFPEGEEYKEFLNKIPNMIEVNELLKQAKKNKDYHSERAEMFRDVKSFEQYNMTEKYATPGRKSAILEIVVWRGFIKLEWRTFDRTFLFWKFTIGPKFSPGAK